MPQTPSITEKIDNSLEQVTTPVFFLGLGLIYIFYFTLLIGISVISRKTIGYINEFLKVIVCIFLLVRFNPFRKIRELKSIDSRIIFTSALIILSTSALSTMAFWVLDTLKISY